ncbi:hypothetical protein A1OE_1429 [Candidatus Endolissoclinum faulkneri L2]|uniref:Uncharacterized protein n=1 Tax=Candidatus Endolissoclinum faulkneri L2 TaxID=1193729 RepID=K7Z627_9PROT|nr:hypothetical protein A1OE_1429 [Candidatus Endolissoclinum faulkneri L2]
MLERSIIEIFINTYIRQYILIRTNAVFNPHCKGTFLYQISVIMIL